MRCMQALIRAQTRVRARRLTSHLPRRATRLDAQYRRPGLVDLVPSRAQGARLSFGHSSATHSLKGTWDAEPADGMPRRRDALAASCGESSPTYACGLQHQRQLNELQLDDNDEGSGGWRWLEHCHTGGQPKQEASQHGPTETSYVTAVATDGVSENTVEMEEAASRKSPTRDLYPVRPPGIPGYMAATQSALAKTRMAPPPAARAGTRTRSGSVALSGGLTSSTANLGWSMSHGAASTHAPQHRAVHSPESSCSGDRTPPVFGDRRKLAFG
nr:unnamed protein product [Digitaria exilis]